MNISLPDNLRAFIDAQVEQAGYGTSSEYVRELIRRDQDHSNLRALLMAGAASPVTGQADEAYVQQLRQRATAAARTNQRGKRRG